MEEMINKLDILEKEYKAGIVNLEDYLKIKSNIVDYYKDRNTNKLPY